MPPVQEQNNFSSDTSESDEGFDRSFSEFVTEKVKVFNDSVHGEVELPVICSKIINTPQFQRLRNLKQLGLCYHVYPAAGHNRFEHCLGVSHLAGQYVKILREKQPELNITEEDIKCLYIAGLCHDLGHGPFSHTWERFMHEIGNKQYSHEEMSLKILDDLIQKNNLEPDLENENLRENDLTFIKELILGHPVSGTELQGRPPSKYFLYQIVSNDRTKIDVDKFDYIMRDCKQLNVASAFDYQRLMANSRVHRDEKTDETIIIYRKKIESTLEELFSSRFSLHKKAYQHRVTKVIEDMVLDGLKAAEDHFQVPGLNGQMYKLSTAYKDIDAFLKLTDSTFERIMLWGDGGTRAAKLFMDIVHRNLYPFLGYFCGQVEKEVTNELQEKDKNIRFITSKINFGNGAKNPLDNVHLYEKARPNHLIQREIAQAPVERRTFIVYCTSGDINEEADITSDSKNETVAETVCLQTAKKEVAAWAERNKIKLEFE